MDRDESSTPSGRRTGPGAARALAALACATALLAAACDRAGGAFAGRLLEPRPAGDAGPFRVAEQRGKVVVVTFGFTSCPDVCPLTLSRLKAALRILGDDAARVSAAFVTVDPERDRPDRLASYVAAFDARIAGVFVQGRALADALGAYGATAEKRVAHAERYRHHPDAESRKSYAVDHTAGFFLVDPRGRLRVFVPHDASAEALAGDIRRLLAERAPPPVRIEAPVAHLTPTGIGAVYFRIVNPAGEEDRLLEVESAAAERVEMHESVREGDTVRMVARDQGFAVPGRETVELSRGGKHLMLLGVRAAAGKPIPLTLRFERSGALAVEAPVEGTP